jgi:hypothetical protein
MYLRIVALSLSTSLTAGSMAVPNAPHCACHARNANFRNQALAPSVAFQINPSEAVRQAVNKLRLTYVGNREAPPMIRELMLRIVNVFVNNFRPFAAGEFHQVFCLIAYDHYFKPLSDEMKNLVHEILWQVLFVESLDEIRYVFGLDEAIEAAITNRRYYKKPIDVDLVLSDIKMDFTMARTLFVMGHRFGLMGAAIFPSQFNPESVSEEIIRKADAVQLQKSGELFDRMVEELVRSKMNQDGRFIGRPYLFPGIVVREDRLNPAYQAVLNKIGSFNAEALSRGSMLHMVFDKDELTRRAA